MGLIDREKEEQELRENLKGIKRKIVVLSGKGGVGKSSVAANLAVYMALQGKKVGLLDIDIHGPSIPTLLGLEGKKVFADKDGKIIPIEFSDNLKVISTAFFLPSENDAVIWRGPLKIGAIKQFLKDVNWGELDVLVVDSPPGTGDEPLTVAQYFGEGTEAIVVTTPQDLSLIDVKKSISFCRNLKLDIAGVIINMSYFVCPNGEKVDVFHHGRLDKFLEEMKVDVLGELPLEPAVSKSGDEGKPFIYHYSNTPAGKSFEEIASKVLTRK